MKESPLQNTKQYIPPDSRGISSIALDLTYSSAHGPIEVKLMVGFSGAFTPSEKPLDV